ncbi:hypothetical protein [Nocardia sp. NPDC059228]
MGEDPGLVDSIVDVLAGLEQSAYSLENLIVVGHSTSMPSIETSHRGHRQ